MYVPEVRNGLCLGSSLAARVPEKEPMRKGNILLQLSGNRKPTCYRCNPCSEMAGHAVWHGTHRNPTEPCPFESEPASRSAAVIERHKLGTFGTKRPKRHIHLTMRDIMPEHIPEGD